MSRLTAGVPVLERAEATLCIYNTIVRETESHGREQRLSPDEFFFDVRRATEKIHVQHKYFRSRIKFYPNRVHIVGITKGLCRA